MCLTGVRDVWAQSAPTSWRALDMTTASDNSSRMMWLTPDNRLVFWQLNAGGVISLYSQFHAISTGWPGWAPAAIRVGGDGLTRVLVSRSSDGSAAVWTLDSQLNYLSSALYISPMGSGWQVLDFAVANDNSQRILWKRTDGAMMVWIVSPTGAVSTSPTTGVYGPSSGWTPRSVAVGNDGQTRVLWNCSDGRSDIWVISADGTSYSTLWAGHLYGPYTNYTATNISLNTGAGSDNKSRVMWRNTNGAVALWKLSSDGSTQEINVSYGPSVNPGWSQGSLSVGGDGNMGLLWLNQSGRADFWRLSGDGTGVPVNVPNGPLPYQVAAPANVSASPGNGQVALSWSPVWGQDRIGIPAASLYRIYRGTASGTYGATPIGTSTSTSFPDPTATNGTAYFYSVRAVDAAGNESLNSNEVSAMPLAAPVAPANLAATSGNASASLSWTASANATSYQVFRSLTSGVYAALPTQTVTTTSFPDTGLTNGTTYYYVVKAVGVGGTSAASSEVSATPAIPTAPSAPARLSATAGDSQVSLSWSASTGATGYKMFRALTAGGYGATPLASGNSTSYVDTGLTNGTTYYYSVKASNAVGDSPFSNEVSALPLAPPPTPAPIPTPALTPAPNAIGAQSTFATSVKSPPVVHTLSFPAQAAGQTSVQSFPITLSAQQEMDITDLNVTPASATTDVVNTIKIYNAAGQAIQSGASTQVIFGGTNASSTPTRFELTSDVQTPVSVSVGTRVMRYADSSNFVSSDSTNVPVIRSKTFTIAGRELCGVGVPDGQDQYFKVHLKAGEILSIISGRVIGRDVSGARIVFDTQMNRGTIWDGVAPNHVSNYIPNGLVAPAEGDYGGDIQATTGGLSPTVVGYSVKFKTSYAPHSPGHDGHSMQPNKHVQQNPQMGGESAMCPNGCGPLSGDPVDLSTGQETYSSGEDLSIYNPSGPNVAFTRYYSNERAASLGNSPGLPVGWSHTYDMRLESNSDGTNWPSMDLVFPNGAREGLAPKVDGSGNLVLDGNGQAQFAVQAGSTYLVTAAPLSASKTYGSARVLWSDGTAWNFQAPSTNFPAHVTPGLLSSIEAPTSSASAPQYITFQWAGDDRDDYHLVSVCNGSDGKALLALGYAGDSSNGFLLTQISDCYGRSIYYANGTLAEAANVPTLTGVSMIAYNGAQAPQRYAFGYVNFSGSPYLSGISVPHPNDASQTASATINYGADGRVSSEVDGNGNTTAFTYGTGQTTVQKFGATNTTTPELAYTALYDTQGRDIGTVDAENNRTATINYGDANNPDKPTSVTDAASRTTNIAYEPNGLGLVSTITSPRGVTTHYGYNYGVWPFGLLAQTYQSTGSGAALVNHPPTTLYYVAGGERAGLVQEIDSPHPNVGAPGWNGATTVSSTLTYNAFGDVTSVITPGHGGYSSLMTVLNYTTDGTAYSQPARRGQVVSVTDPTGAVSSFRYDARGNGYGTRDALNRVSTATFDLADNPTSQTLPPTGQTGNGAGSVTFAYNYLGGMLKTTNSYDESGSGTPFRSVTTNYDAEGRTLSVGGATEPVATTYTSFDAPKTLSDGSGHTTTYSYNLRGLLTQIVRPLGNAASGLDVVKFTNYAPDGSLLSETDGRGLTTTISHNDPEGEVSQINLPDETITLARDGWGRLTGRTDASGSQTYAFSDADALLSTTTNYLRADGTSLPALTLGNGYEADGTRSGLYGSSGSPTAAINLSYGFDARGSLTQLNDNAQSLISRWSYDAGARLQNATAANGWNRGYTYNPLDQVLALTQAKSGQSNMDFGHPTDPNKQLRYDGQGNMTREVANFGAGANATGTTTYGYDGNDRLNSENSSRFSNYARTYSLDNAYNRIASTGTNGASPSWSRTLSGNANNQVTGIATTQNGVTTNATYGYDGEGNRSSFTSNGTTTNYTYDSQQRLTQVTQSVNGAAATAVLKCGYRADGLRAWKENAQGRTYFLYDGDALVGEFDSTGTMQVSQTWGAEGLAYRRTASGTSAGTRFYSWDTRGNVAATTDASGNVVNTPSSDGFSSSGGVEPCATFGGQVGGYRDSETGLVLFGQRCYDSSLGSWLTRDPIGENGGINLYSYVQGNPTNEVDPSGLQPPAAPAGTSILDEAAAVFSGGVQTGARVVGGAVVGVFGGVLLLQKPLADDSMGPAAKTKTKKQNPDVFERFCSKLEADNSVLAQELLPRPGHEKNGKWIQDLGVRKTGSSLGQTKNYTHKITITTTAGTRNWMKSSGFEWKTNEPGSYEIPAAMLPLFNDRVRAISPSLSNPPKRRRR